MTIVKVKDYARLIKELDATIRVKCFTDELDKEPMNMDGTELKTDEISSSFVFCNCSCSCH